MVLISLAASCSQMFYHPERKDLSHNFLSPPPAFKDIYFISNDGVRLHGRLFLAQGPSKGTLVQFHGNGENLTAHYRSLIWAIEHGYHLFTFDYRGYGQSASQPTPQGVLGDGLSALREARKIHLAHASKGKFIVVGQSLGGAVALRAVNDFSHRDLIDLIVVDSAFYSYQKIAFKKLSSHWLTWAFSPLAYVLISDKTSADMQNLRHPLLVIHSQNDPVVPFACGYAIYQQAASAQKTFWPGQQQGHIHGFASKQQQQRFLKFLAAL